MTVTRYDTPKNINEVVFPIEEVEVASWTPERDGKGKCTQVHMILKARGAEHPMVVRFKSPVTLQNLIDSLIEHRDYVFGKKP